MTGYPLTILAFVVLLIPPVATSAESGADIIDRMIAAEAENYAGVDNLFQISRMVGQRVPEYLEKHGGYLRSVPMGELLERQQSSPMTEATPEQLKRAADALRLQSGRADAAMQDEIAKSGIGGGVMGPIIHKASNPPEKWLTSSPGGMMSLYATMLDASADAKVQMKKQKQTDLAENIDNDALIEQIKSQTRVVGRSSLAGHAVIEIGADDLDVRQVVDGGDFTMESVRILVDEESYLPRQFRIEGTLRQGKESQAMTIERTDSVFQGGDDCGTLSRPRKSVMRLAGALSPKQQAELETARQQLANLPPEQKEMMKRMMGEAQFNMIENMAAGGGIEIVSDVLGLRCNSNPPTAEELTKAMIMRANP
jgi:hypothetical protein